MFEMFKFLHCRSNLKTEQSEHLNVNLCRALSVLGDQSYKILITNQESLKLSSNAAILTFLISSSKLSFYNNNLFIAQCSERCGKPPQSQHSDLAMTMPTLFTTVPLQLFARGCISCYITNAALLEFCLKENFSPPACPVAECLNLQGLKIQTNKYI